MTIETTIFCIIITANEGNVFRSKISGDVLTNKLYLGCNDMADNYEEISEEDAYVLEEEKESTEIQTEEENGI